MFTELMPVIADRPLTITVASLAGGKVRVCVIPQSQEKDGAINGKGTHPKEVAKIPDASIKALTTPLVLTGSPEELDADIARVLTTYVASHEQLQHGIAQATQEITEALRAIEERSKTQNIKPKQKTDAKRAGSDKTSAEGDAKPGGAESASATLPLAWCAEPVQEAVSAQDGASGKNGNDGGARQEAPAQ